MRRRAMRTPLGVHVIPLLVVFGTFAEGFAVARPGDVTSFPAAQDTLVGTVRAVDYDTQTVEVLTGVGLAVRVVRVLVYPGVPVSMEGQERPLADLRRGQIVRVVYRVTVEGKVATSLEVVPRTDAGGAP